MGGVGVQVCRVGVIGDGVGGVAQAEWVWVWMDWVVWACKAWTSVLVAVVWV